MGSERPLLQVRELSVRFGQSTVVDRITFELQKGECLGIVGASGSGKSVTSLALMRLLDERSAQIEGSVLYAGVDLLDLKENEMRRYRGKEIAMIFQEPMTALDPVYTVGEQVAGSLRMHLRLDRKAARDRAIQLFDEVQLPDPASIHDRYPHQLSGGQKQRVVIAMALSCSPKILICDEPTTALDVLVQREIIELLERIQRERGMGMLFITHDLGVVREIADRALVMFNGKVVEDAPVTELFDRPQHPYTKGLIACRPDPGHHPKRLPTIDEVMSKAAAGIQLPLLSISRDDRRKYVEDLLKEPPLLQVEGLDKIFISRTGAAHILHDISFAVHPGETLGIVGGSGSGKTTLGRSILRLTEATNGSIRYRPAGSSIPLDLTELDATEMRRMRRELQIIFQDPYSSLNPRITIGAAIMEAMRVHNLGGNDGERRERTIHLLESVGLGAMHFDRFPHQFSGGQRQRIVIARAIALEPRLIICDESVAALDVSVQAQVLNLLNDLKQTNGLTYIFISHDLSVVKYFCDRILVLEKGSNVEMGIADEIYYAPQAPYTRRLIDAIPGKK